MSNRKKDYWDDVSNHDDFEATRANPDHLATPDPVDELADKSLLYQTVSNMREPYKDLLINHLGLFGREPMSIRQYAKVNNISKDKVFRLFKRAQEKARAEFFRLLEGGKIDEVPNVCDECDA